MKKLAVLLIAVALLLPLNACGDRGVGMLTGEPYTFVDDTGVELTTAKAPKRVAVLVSSFAQVWTLAGGEVAITVGESVERGFAATDALLVDSGAGKSINTELLLSYAPDLVIGSADLEAHVTAANLLSKAGIPCALFRVDAFRDYLQMLDICTDITGNKDAYEENGVAVGARIDTLLAKVERTAGQEILFIRSGAGQSSAKAKTAKDNFVCAMLQELGTHNIAENAPVLLDGLSMEEILSADPDYIFLSPMGDEVAARAYMDGVLAGEDWGRLTAVAEGNYNYLPKELFQFKPNARWDEAYQYLIDLLYPTGV